MDKTPSLDFLFRPKTLAIAGVSANIGSILTLPQRYIRSLIDFGFKGKIYPVHPAGGEIFGLKVYKDVEEISDSIDYVVSAIPARLTPQLLTGCTRKKVKAVHLFTSGFSEIEDEVGKILESEVVDITRKNGIRILGPNCMGIYCPAAGLTFAADYPEQRGFPSTPGPLGLISQSGGNTTYCIREATTRGIYFSKAISYGNAADLNESDFLEYLTDDPNTKVIAIYIEGVKDGPRFIRTLKRAASFKPVIIYKSGNTETGVRACASHTSAMAGSANTWNSFLKQTGAIQVNSMEEIVDVSLLFLKMSVPRGRNAVVIGVGGGAGVLAADDCTEAGLILPLLSQDVRQGLRKIYGSEAGSIFRNPVDVPGLSSKDMLVNAVKSIAASELIDIIIMHFPFDLWALAYRKEMIGQYIESVVELASSVGKPMASVLHFCATIQSKQLAAEVQEKFVNSGLPVYPGFKRAASAINKYRQYHERGENG